MPGGEPATCAGWNSSGDRCAVGTDRALRLHEFPSGTLKAMLPLRGGATALAFDPRGEHLAGAGSWLTVWNVAQRKPLGVERQLPGLAKAMCFSADGERLTCEGRDDITRTFRIGEEAVEPLAPVPSRRRSAGAIAFDWRSQTLLIAGTQPLVRSWPLTGTRLIHDVRVFRPIVGLVVVANGSRVIVLQDDGFIRVFEPPSPDRTSLANADHVGRRAELLSGLEWRSDSRLVPLTQAEWLTRWQQEASHSRE